MRPAGVSDTSDGSDGLGEPTVDGGADIRPKSANSVTAAKERKVAGDDVVEQREHVGFCSALVGGLVGWRIADVVRSATEDDAGPAIEVDVAERLSIQPDPVHLAFIQPTKAHDGRVLIVGRGLLGADRQKRETAQEKVDFA